MRGIAVESLAAVVGIIIISLLLIGLLAAGGDLGKMFPQMVIGSIPKIRPPLASSAFGVESVDLTGLGLPTTATEVGCSIAKTIRDDFVRYGESDSAGRGQALALSDKLRVIGAKKFAIDIDTINYGTFTHYWESASLTEDQRKKIAEACGLDTPLLPNCPQHLDEACVSLLLNRMKVGEKKLCTGASTVNVGGENLKFGNSKCENVEVTNVLAMTGQATKDIIKDIFPPSLVEYLTKKKKVASTVSPDWVQDCQICPDADRITSWTSGGADYFTSTRYGKDYQESTYKVKDSKVDFFPPGYENCSVTSQATGYYTPNNCVPDFMYVVYWNTGTKSYQVSMPRIPKGQDIGTADPAAVAKDLGALFKDNDYNARGTPAGLLYPELRMIRNITFRPSQKMLINDFAAEYVKAIQVKSESDSSALWTFRYNQCDGPDCYVTLPKQTQYKRARQKIMSSDKSVEMGGWIVGSLMEWATDSTFGDMNYKYWSEKDSCQKQLKADNPDFKTIQVNSNLIVNEEYLEPNKTYNVIVTYWMYDKSTGWGGPSCGAMGVPGECKFCINSCTDKTNRWSYDCKGGPSAKYDGVRTDTLYYDYSLIIVDNERLEAFYNV
ncbi:MAG: hypothetical protein QXU82_01460 [Candidatus Aenigmatarchaeota archaeon]